jgi:hypothetical protein
MKTIEETYYITAKEITSFIVKGKAIEKTVTVREADLPPIHWTQS